MTATMYRIRFYTEAGFTSEERQETLKTLPKQELFSLPELVLGASQKQEQDEDDQEHYCPLSVSAEYHC